MNLHNPIKNCTTYTIKDRLPIQKLLSYQDVRCDMIEIARRANLPEPSEEEILNECDRRGVNLETVQSKRNATSPGVKCNSSQRMDMAQGHITSSVPLANPDYPVFDSCMRHDIWTKSSCVKRASGVIKVLAAIKYQFRTIYIYELNGEYDYFDTNSGIIESNGFGSILHSDLRDLPIGEYVDISKDSFLLSYPHQYNSTTDTVGMGRNIRTICATNWDNSGDPVLVSENFIRQFTTFKTKTINIHLSNKSIKSKYPGKFPELGEFIKDTILFKVCNDIGVVSELSQSPNTATGVEDDTIVVEPNTFISSVEVYCNSPIKDPDLEKMRSELLDFRHKVYNTVAPLVDHFPDKCSYKLKVLKGNYQHDLFQVSNQELKYPFIRIKTVTVDVPTKGVKVSNNLGSKVTVQRIYPDGWFRDELGRNIDMIFPSTAIINRTVAGVPWEIYMTSFSDLLHHRVVNNEITPERTFEFVEKFMTILGVEKEFRYSKFNPTTLFEYLKQDYLRIILMPYSNNINLDLVTNKLQPLAEEYLGYRKFDIYVGSKKDPIKLTSQHTVGLFYTIRDYHDPQYGNSSCSVVERNTKGFAVDKDSSKRDGRSLTTKKCVKYDVQLQHIAINMASNATVDIMLNGSDSEVQYAIKETMAGAGIELGFKYINQKEGEDE